MLQVCLRSILMVTLFFSLTACSGTYRTYYQSLRYALKETPDVALSLAEVQASQVDLMYVRYGSLPQAVMALAFIEQGQHKWVSADNKLLVLASGRVVSTSGLTKDLVHLASASADPLMAPLATLADKTWQRSLDWSNDEYGYALSSVFSAPVSEVIRVFEQPLSVLRVTENVTYQAPSAFLRTDRQWQNTYWFSEDGQMVKSQQQLSPETVPLELIFVSRVARLVSQE